MADASLRVPSTVKSGSKTSLKSGSKVSLKSGSKASLKSGSKSSLRAGSKASLRSKSRLRNASRTSFRDGDDEGWLQAKDPVRPPDQLELSEADLKHEFTRILNANNPYAPHNIVSFSYKEREFRQTSTVEQMATHFSLDGNSLHKESDEGRRQLAGMNRGRRRPAVEAETATEEPGDVDGPETKDEGVGDDAPLEEGEEGAAKPTEGEEEEEQPDEPEPEAAANEPAKPLRNQFNYSERASQTFNQTHKERGVSTDPPSRLKFSGLASQYTIYDAFVADQEAKAAAARAKGKKKGGDKDEATPKPSQPSLIADRGDDSGSGWGAVGKVVSLADAKKIERMVLQNSHDEVIQDYAFYDDPSDSFKENEGTVLPLWKFANETTKKMTVTAVSWNPAYTDMFAVGIGSYDFTKQGAGAIAVYSLKNPAFPEILFSTKSGVMCLDFHEEHPSLLAVGLYDGTVQVHDLSIPTRDVPLFKSTAKTGKHTDPVWQIRWQPDDMDKNRNFCTVASDGRVTCWTLVKTDLQFTDIIKLKLDATESADPSEAAPLFGLGSGTCFAFSKGSSHVFLVGTEEGKVHKCSKAYSSKFLKTYDAHSMAVYTIAWNPFVENVFLTCSADWMVKLWDGSSDTPIFSFDLGNPVGSVDWAPYSSCVFAAVTTDGKVHIFDLSQDKYSPLCEQQVLRKSKPTHIRFSKVAPVLLMGDDRGAVTCLKVSPNLRKAAKDKKMREAEAQVEALTRVLDSVKELPLASQEGTQT